MRSVNFFIFLFLIFFFSISFVSASFVQIISDKITTRATEIDLDVSVNIEGAPSLVILSPTDGGFFKQNVTINFTSFGADNFWYNIDNGTNISVIENFTVSFFVKDTYTLYLYANNSAGITKKFVSFTIGEVPPEEPTVPPSQGEKCTNNWSCTEWNLCSNGVQTRVCTDLNNCERKEAKPDEERSCVVGLCIDGSSYGSCSDVKPLLCKSGGALTEDCSTCGCPEGETCFSDGSCGFKCKDDGDCSKGFECKLGICVLEEFECEFDFQCAVTEYCKQGECTEIIPLPAPPTVEIPYKELFFVFAIIAGIILLITLRRIHLIKLLNNASFRKRISKLLKA